MTKVHGNVGRKLTEEHKRKISEALKGTTKSLEERQAIRDSILRKKDDPEYRKSETYKKMCEAGKAYWTPERIAEAHQKQAAKEGKATLKGSDWIKEQIRLAEMASKEN